MMGKQKQVLSPKTGKLDDLDRYIADRCERDPEFRARYNKIKDGDWNLRRLKTKIRQAGKRGVRYVRYDERYWIPISK